jgi:hypothetical protein
MITRLAMLGALTAEALTIYVVNAWFGALYDNPALHRTSALSIIAAAWIAYLIVPLADRFDVTDRLRTIGVSVFTVAAIYGILRLDFAGDFALWDFSWVGDFMRNPSTTMETGGDAVIGLVFILAAWVRALVRGSEDIDLERLPNSLGIAFVVTTVVLILGSFSDAAAGGVGAGAAIFYAVAVISMTLSQLARSGATIGMVRAGGVVSALLAGTVAVTIVGLVLTVLIWGPLQGPLSAALSVSIEKAVIAVLTPPLWLLEKIFQLIIPDANFAEPAEFARDVSDGNFAGSDRAEDERTNPVLIFLSRAGVLVFAAAAVGGAVWLVARLRNRRRTTVLEGAAMGSAGGLGDDLRSLWRRVRPHRPQPAAASRDDPATRLYLDVLHEAERQGRARHPWITPREFDPELDATFHTAVTADITRAFDDVRYGGHPPDEISIAELERRWQQARHPGDQHGT